MQEDEQEEPDIMIRLSLGVSDLFLGLHQGDVQLVQLLLGHLAGGAHHYVHGVLVHGEGDDLPDGVLAGEPGMDHPVQPRGAMPASGGARRR